MNDFLSEYSDYIIYVDESGDHGLASIDENYPVFVLCFCSFLKRYYSEQVTPALRVLKFETFGHDMVILLKLIIADKKTNSEGLQFADLAARPVGLSAFRSDQPNRAFKTLEKKFHRNAHGEIAGHGISLHP
ncbi:MAG TPA: DUF3800 domain-containing protein [Chlamydiales bacterium]|nr:DUF3800 domain-containing protein [Chlamydiales bacterium]